MTMFIARAVLLTFALVGCGDDPATTPTPPARLQLSGRCETALAPTQVLAPGVVRQVDTGSCQLSELGRAAFTSDKLIRTDPGTQTTEASFAPASGDTLFAVGRGTNVPTTPGRVRFTATLTFVGGTGRFVGATGQVTVEGESDLVGRQASLTLAGWVASGAGR